MDKKTKRNVAIAIVFLVVLLVEPFWGPIKSAITGEDATTGASQNAPELTCTVAVSVQPALDNLDLVKEEVKDLLPADGWLLAETEMTVTEGTTVLEVLQWAAQEEGIPVITSGTPPFVESIGGVTNGDGGDVSGWTYTLNGESLMESAAIQTVAAGDAIQWNFICTWE